MKTLILIAGMYLFTAGATSIETFSTRLSDTTSLNGQWFLLPVLPSDTAAGRIPTLNISLAGSSFSGNTGCNTMRGSFKKTDSSLVFNPNLATTKMNCPGYDEAAFIKSLQRANRYKFDNGVLVLMFEATELSRWARKPEKKIKMNRA